MELNKVIGDIDEVQAILELVQKNKTLSSIDKDLLLNKLRSAYDHIVSMQTSIGAGIVSKSNEGVSNEEIEAIRKEEQEKLGRLLDREKSLTREIEQKYQQQRKEAAKLKDLLENQESETRKKLKDAQLASEQALVNKKAESINNQITPGFNSSKAQSDFEANLKKKQAELKAKLEQSLKNPATTPTTASISIPQVKKTPEETFKTEVSKQPEAKKPESILNTQTPEPKETAMRIGDKFEASKSRNDEIKTAPKIDLSASQNAKPISSIAEAIGVNEKYGYVKELFGDDSRLFKKTIEYLDESTDAQEAISFLKETYAWEENNKHASELFNLVRRKFSNSAHV